MRPVRWTSLLFLGWLLVAVISPAGGTSAGAPAPTTSLGALVVSPPGCVAPQPALAVFRARLINLDDPPTTAEFRVQSMLAGSLDGYSQSGRVLVVYGQEASFLEIGTRYIVGVHADLDTGRLTSAILQPEPLFGGDAVIGLNDIDLECPRVEDPIKTLLADGSSVDSGVLTPLKGSGPQVLDALVQPLALAVLLLIALVLVKDMIKAMGRSLRETTGPVQVARLRHHGAAPSGSAVGSAVGSVDGDQRQA